MGKYRLDFRFNFNHQTGGSNIQAVRTKAAKFSQFVVTDVAVGVADSRYRELVNKLDRSIESAIHRELDYISGYIGKHVIGARDGAPGPRGNLSHRAGQAAGLPPSLRPNLTMGLRAVTPPWSPRGADYLKQKQRKYGHRQWWKNTGSLGATLSEARVYEQVYGPIKVSLVRNSGNNLSKASRGADIRPGPWGKSLVETPRLRGKGVREVRVAIGSLRVSAFGRITPGMLKARATLNPVDFKNSDLISPFIGVGGRGGDAFDKLAGQSTRPHRYVIEPFVSWFLTRAVPNAVQKRLERTIK